ncbi:MAG: glycosyltransferase family 1 protein [Synechococcales bacterium]|nr:glycosyltransferase family 1 protein [Synechococcales bacterium]
MSEQLIINLSFLMTQPTGHSIYARNIIPALRSFQPKLLVSEAALPQFPDHFVDHSDYIAIPGNMNPDHGSKGHLRRLLWTQFRLPARHRQLRGSLLFTPIPEMPLWSRIPSVVTLHDLIPLRFPRKRSPLTTYARYYVPQVLKQAKHVICDSEATAQDAIDFYKIPASKLTSVPLAHDASHFRFLDLPTQNYFLYIGRCDPHKNLQRAIAAFAQLPQHSDYEFWIAGTPDPRYTPMLEAEAWDLGVQVRFLNYVAYDDLPRLINQAIAVVFPSLWEGFGLPVLEAMACGTPVITSNLSSLPEVAGEAALLVDPYNVNAIAEAMQMIVEQPQVRSQLRFQGLQQAKQFSWEKTGMAIGEILKSYL